MIPLADVERALASVGLISGLPADEVQARLRQGLTLREAGQRALAFYLHEMEEMRLFRKTGHSSAVQYAEQRLELDRRRARELITVGRKLRTLPQIDLAFCKRQISWSKVLLLAGVAVPEHEGEWLATAQKQPVRELALAVRSVAPGAPPPKGSRKGMPEVRFKVEASVGVVAHEKWEQAKRKLSAECGRALSEAEVIEMLAELALQTQPDGSVAGRVPVDVSLYRILLQPGEDIGGLCVDTEDGYVQVPNPEALVCDAEVVHLHDDEGVSRGDADGADHRHDDLDPPTPGWLRRKVLARDGHRCRCCGSRRNLMAHHIEHRSHGGATKAFNLVTVCGDCHALIHERLVVVAGTRADDLRFLDSQGRPLGESDLLAGRLSAHPLPMPPAPAPEPSRALSSLEAVPQFVDGAWWRGNSHLIRFAAGGLQFEEGAPLPDEATGEAHVPPPPASVPPFTFDRDAMRSAFGELFGQGLLVDRLEMMARGSALQQRAFPHTLLTGPAGTGKSTIAQGIAAGLGRDPVKAVGPMLQDVNQLVRHLACLRAGDVFFVEEVHATPRPVLEALYEAMSERRITLTLQAGARAKPVTLGLPEFTLVAATTEEGTMPAPFLSRFGLREYLQPYAREVLAAIAEREAGKHALLLEPEAAGRLADFARGIPREAIRLAERVTDAALVEGVARVRGADATRYLVALGYDTRGLQPLEQRYLAVLQASPVPLSLVRMSHLLGAHPQTLLREVEPHLTRAGLLEVTPRGRAFTRIRRPLVA